MDTVLCLFIRVLHTNLCLVNFGSLSMYSSTPTPPGRLSCSAENTVIPSSFATRFLMFALVGSLLVRFKMALGLLFSSSAVTLAASHPSRAWLAFDPASITSNASLCFPFALSSRSAARTCTSFQWRHAFVWVLAEEVVVAPGVGKQENAIGAVDRCPQFLGPCGGPVPSFPEE